MPLIELETRISAPAERVFDLSRSIDAHMQSTKGTRERAVDGRTSGLIGLEETVTWEAVHFGIRQRLSVWITEFDRPHSFTDEMTRGVFQSMRHRHLFTSDGKATLMKDEFHFEAPLGMLGRIAEVVILTRYMTRFLELRNQSLKELAESNEWRRYLNAA